MLATYADMTYDQQLKLVLERSMVENHAPSADRKFLPTDTAGDSSESDGEIFVHDEVSSFTPPPDRRPSPTFEDGTGETALQLILRCQVPGEYSSYSNSTSPDSLPDSASSPDCPKVGRDDLASSKFGDMKISLDNERKSSFSGTVVKNSTVQNAEINKISSKCNDNIEAVRTAAIRKLHLLGVRDNDMKEITDAKDETMVFYSILNECVLISEQKKELMNASTSKNTKENKKYVTPPRNQKVNANVYQKNHCLPDLLSVRALIDKVKHDTHKMFDSMYCHQLIDLERVQKEVDQYRKVNMNKSSPNLGGSYPNILSANTKPVERMVNNSIDNLSSTMAESPAPTSNAESSPFTKPESPPPTPKAESSPSSIEAKSFPSTKAESFPPSVEAESCPCMDAEFSLSSMMPESSPSTKPESSPLSTKAESFHPPMEDEFSPFMKAESSPSTKTESSPSTKTVSSLPTKTESSLSTKTESSSTVIESLLSSSKSETLPPSSCPPFFLSEKDSPIQTEFLQQISSLVSDIPSNSEFSFKEDSLRFGVDCQPREQSNSNSETTPSMKSLDIKISDPIAIPQEDKQTNKLNERTRKRSLSLISEDGPSKVPEIQSADEKKVDRKQETGSMNAYDVNTDFSPPAPKRNRLSPEIGTGSLCELNLASDVQDVTFSDDKVETGRTEGSFSARRALQKLMNIEKKSQTEFGTNSSKSSDNLLPTQNSSPISVQNIAVPEVSPSNLNNRVETERQIAEKDGALSQRTYDSWEALYDNYVSLLVKAQEEQFLNAGPSGYKQLAHCEMVEYMNGVLFHSLPLVDSGIIKWVFNKGHLVTLRYRTSGCPRSYQTMLHQPGPLCLYKDNHSSYTSNKISIKNKQSVNETESMVTQENAHTEYSKTDFLDIDPNIAYSANDIKNLVDFRNNSIGNNMKYVSHSLESAPWDLRPLCVWPETVQLLKLYFTSEGSPEELQCEELVVRRSCDERSAGETVDHRGIRRSSSGESDSRSNSSVEKRREDSKHSLLTSLCTRDNKARSSAGGVFRLLLPSALWYRHMNPAARRLTIIAKNEFSHRLRGELKLQGLSSFELIWMSEALGCFHSLSVITHLPPDSLCSKICMENLVVDQSNARRLLVKAIEGLDHLIKEYNDEHQKYVSAALMELFKRDCFETIDTLSKNDKTAILYNTVVIGDLSLRNLVVQTSKTRVNAIKPLSWHACRIGNGLFDLAYLLAGCTQAVTEKEVIVVMVQRYVSAYNYFQDNHLFRYNSVNFTMMFRKACGLLVYHLAATQSAYRGYTGARQQLFLTVRNAIKMYLDPGHEFFQYFPIIEGDPSP